MSIGPMGFVSFVAGAPLAAGKGSEIERSLHASSDKDRQVQGDKKASDAAGIGSTDGQDHQTEERDADGRRLWEGPLAAKPVQEEIDEGGPVSPRSKDASGDSGS